MTPDAPGSSTFRAFIAITPPETVREELGRDVRYLKSQDSGDTVRWASPDAMHLTLAFLGQIEEDSANSLLGALTSELASVRPFDLSIGKLGTFGDRRRRGGAQVVWAGLDGDTDALSELQKRVTEAVRQAGLRVESRRFQPHITLGRVRRGHRWHLNTADTPSLSTNSFRVTAVNVMESRLGQGPAEYVERGAVQLTETANRP